MENTEYELLNYTTDTDTTEATILVVRNGVPTALYHVPSHGYSPPDLPLTAPED